MDDRNVFLVFDKSSTKPFYVREGVGLGCVFHELKAVTEPSARTEMAKLGFDRNAKMVSVRS